MNSFKKWFLFWVVAVCLSCYIRLYPLRAHLWDPSYDQASLAVVYNIKELFLKQIHLQAPQVPFDTAVQLATEKLNETLHKDSYQFQEAVEKASQKIFLESKRNPNTYLLESDPFYFYYLTDNIVKTGRIAEQIRGSKYFEPLMTAPHGYWQPMTYHPYVGFWVYKIFKIFNPDISLMAAVAYTPLIIISLVLAAFFLLCHTLEISAAASFISGLFFVMTPVILKRSSLGWYDTDPYNLFFPLLLLTVLMKAITEADTKKTLKWTILFSIIITSFASIWQGWGFMLAITLAILFATGIYSLLVKRDLLAFRQYFFTGISFLIATVIGISLLFGFSDFFSLLKEGFGELQKFSLKGISLWPNLFMEVGELKRSSTKDIISDSGGIIFLFAGLVSSLYALWQTYKVSSEKHTLKIIALSIFFLVCSALTVSAERFDIFALMALSVFLSIGLDASLKKISSYKIPWLRIGLIIFLTLFIFINAQRNIRISLTPIFNSSWEKALVDIKNKTPQDSIINTWWPPGHFIKSISHRRVMFDGATLGESATGYWIANVLLSDNEDQAAGLLRMINLGGNQAVDYLISKGFKTSQAVALLSTIASKTNNEAKTLLEAALNNDENAQTLLTMVRGGSPHSYILLYNELVEQNLGLVFMGRWNIQRMEKLNENPSLLASVPKQNSPAYIDFLWSLAGGPTHYSAALTLLKQDDRSLLFSENLVIEKSTMKASINSPTYGQGSPTSIVYLDGQRIIEKVNPTANLKYSIVLYRQDGQMMARLMDRSIANSLLIKLFFFDAVGLDHFKLLTSSSDLTGRTQIKVFETSWD